MQDACTSLTVWYGGRGFMLWGHFAGVLHKIGGIMRTEYYVGILQYYVGILKQLQSGRFF